MSVFGFVTKQILKGKKPNIIGGSDSLESAPNVANIPNLGETYIGQNKKIIDSAQQYSKNSGLELFTPSRYQNIDPEFSAQTANDFDFLKANNSQDPRVLDSYEALKQETEAQYRQMMKDNVKITYGTYDTPYFALKDLTENNALKVFPTDAGGVKSLNLTGNPLADMSPFKTADGEPMRYNDIFRAVHDYYGHGKHGVGFRAGGEDMAYISHAGMFSPKAMGALATETRGQNSFLNFGKDALFNRTANQVDTIYAPQKFDILPANTILNRTNLSENRFLREQNDLSEKGLLNRIGNAVDKDGNLNMFHFSRGGALDRIDPNFYGTAASRKTIGDRNFSYNDGFLNRSFYGIEGEGIMNPYKQEAVLRSVGANARNDVKIPLQQIYNPRVDPDNFFSTIDAMRSKGGFKLSPAEQRVEFDKLVTQNRYSGYLEETPAGKRVTVFDPIRTIKK